MRFTPYCCKLISELKTTSVQLYFRPMRYKMHIRCYLYSTHGHFIMRLCESSETENTNDVIDNNTVIVFFLRNRPLLYKLVSEAKAFVFWMKQEPQAKKVKDRRENQQTRRLQPTIKIHSKIWFLTKNSNFASDLAHSSLKFLNGR